jgi:hypothetical protein
VLTVAVRADYGARTINRARLRGAAMKIMNIPVVVLVVAIAILGAGPAPAWA